MANLNIYLSFDGKCKEAMEFYNQVLGGKLEMMTYGSSPMPIPEEHKDRILHAHIVTENFMFMAADSMPGQEVVNGNNFSMSLAFTTNEEQEEIWNKLSVNAKIQMPLAEQFWGARFGMLTDQFGINWMLNCEPPRA